MSVRLAEIKLPEFGVPDIRPTLSQSTYETRFDRFRAMIREAGLDAAIIYADREHFANMAYLVGFEPRFEEALLIIVNSRRPVILTGPENAGLAAQAQIEADVRTYATFGLLGQDRSRTRPLRDLLSEAGLGGGQSVGSIGWKYFTIEESSEPENWLELPSYVADTVRHIVGPEGRVVNATALLMAPTGGLRADNEIDQLAIFEFSSCHTSEAVKRVLFGIQPGMREFEAAKLMQPVGIPQSCHPMLSTGPRAFFGLNSPSDKIIERGDPFTTCLGLWGALTSRAGFLVAGPDELPIASRDYVERLVGPYFACAAEWYETVGIGVSGGEIDAVVKRHLGDPFFGVLLNPGHLIHLDEWLSTPIYPGSSETLRSGQALQCDIIPATGTPLFTSNIEDGIALLDERGRDELRDRYPGMTDRIARRRAFMADELGIRLKPEIQPFSNIPAYLPPFVLSPTTVLTKA